MSYLILTLIIVLLLGGRQVIAYRRYLKKPLREVISPALKHQIEKEDAQAQLASKRFQKILEEKRRQS